MKGLSGGYFAFSVTTILFSSLPDCTLTCVPLCGTRDVHINGIIALTVCFPYMSCLSCKSTGLAFNLYFIFFADKSLITLISCFVRVFTPFMSQLIFNKSIYMEARLHSPRL